MMPDRFSSGIHLVGAGHLRDGLRADEGTELDLLDPGFGEPVAQLDLLGDAENRRFVLQPVAGADVDDSDFLLIAQITPRS
jgi:hypothetical protein